MDRRLHHRNNNDPYFHIHHAPLEAAWRASRHSCRGGGHLPVVHTLSVLLRLQPYHPDVPPGSAQEPDCRLALCDVVRLALGDVVDFGVQARVGSRRCAVGDERLQLDVRDWNVCVYLGRLVSRYLEGIHFCCLF